MIRVGDITLFHPLEAGELALFTDDRPRTVRLTFNAPQRTVINVLDVSADGEVPENAEPVFLAIVEGLEEVEFVSAGAFAVSAEADRVYLKTIDGQKIHAVVPDAVTFTRIAERRVRNPDLERMQELLLQNQNRRMGALYEDIRREREAIAREREALHSAAGAPDGGGEPPVSAVPRAGTPPVSPPKDGAGSEGGEGDA